MKAVGYQHSHPIEHPEALLDIELPDPEPGARDLLVDVRAVSANPVDTKMRVRSQPAAGEWQVLGWDAAGVVKAVGSEVSAFNPGDRVWYAGSIARPGTNSELHLVDERIVGRAPETLEFAQTAALPLTTITAWEMLFDRLQIPTGNTAAGDALLIIGAPGGVGSIMTQLARQMTDVTVIGTASSPESEAWVRDLGAHHVIDHRRPLSDQIIELGTGPVRYVASLTHSDSHLPQVAELIAPQGKYGLIDDPTTLEVGLLKQKSVSLHWEFMFTRAVFETDDMARQGQLLNDVAKLVDDGKLCSTIGEHYGTIDAANLRRAHAMLESGRARGKIVLEGFAGHQTIA